MCSRAPAITGAGSWGSGSSPCSPALWFCPGPTLLVVAIFFGVQLIVAGIFRFVAAFAADELTGGTRALLAVLGIISLILGLYAVRHVLITLLALVLLLGIFWIINGQRNCSWRCPARK